MNPHFNFRSLAASGTPGTLMHAKIYVGIINCHYLMPLDAFQFWTQSVGVAVHSVGDGVLRLEMTLSSQFFMPCAI